MPTTTRSSRKKTTSASSSRKKTTTARSKVDTAQPTNRLSARRKTSTASSRKTSTSASKPKKSGLSMREAAIEVFRANGNQPMKVADLYEAMSAQRNYKPSKAATPTATLAATMYTRPQQFEKVEKGLFRANPDYLKSQQPEPEPSGDRARSRKAVARGA